MSGLLKVKLWPLYVKTGFLILKIVNGCFLETDATSSIIPKNDRDFSNAKFEGVSGFPPKGMNS